MNAHPEQSGFVLERMEVLNWGNFQKWQVIDFSRPGMPLFSQPQAQHSMIAGINGSGKSTLIDGMMVVLLPFEGMVKLRVTHDVASGTGGGGTIRDYVLGKYSSTGGEILEGTNQDQIYSRKSGFSAVLLVFRHQGDPGRVITLGRGWWYHQHKIKEDQASWVVHGPMSIGNSRGPNLLDTKGQLFGNAREFRIGMAQKSDLRIQVFDKVSAYFQVLSGALGGITKEDLKLLNQAFYVKSIDQIDSFIRGTMLLPSDQDSITRLMSHVDHASEISAKIELCERKLEGAKKVRAELQNYQEATLERKGLEVRRRIVKIFPDWLQIDLNQSKLIELGEKRSTYEASLPQFEQQQETYQQQLNRLDSLIAKNDLTAALKNIELETELTEKSIARAQESRGKVSTFCKKLGWEVPEKAKDLIDFEARKKELAEELQGKSDFLQNLRNELSAKHHENEKQVEEVRADLQFMSEHQTMIPRKLYAIKEQCMAALDLPDNALLFVGELIAVKKNCQEYRKAVEAALHPISRNLLCHPEYLEKVTRWLNKTGLKQTVTVKRIKAHQMEGKPRQKFESESILSKIEMRPKDENPFFDYLWNWLSEHFYHSIVEATDFKKEIQKAVTREGLVKQDAQTMKKFKEDLEYSLGWSTEAEQKELIDRLSDLARQHQHFKAELDSNDQQMKAVQSLFVTLETLKTVKIEYLELSELERRLEFLMKSRKELEQKNQSYRDLLKEQTATRDLLKNAMEEIARLKAGMGECDTQVRLLTEEIRRKQDLIGEFHQQLIPGQKKRLNEVVPNLEEALHSVQKELKKRKLAHTAYSDELDQLIVGLENKMKGSKVNTWMAEFQREYQDPNLHYELRQEEDLGPLLQEWNETVHEIEATGLPQAKAKWIDFYNNTLLDSIKTFVNEIRSEHHKIESNVASINSVLKQTDYENLPTERRYLQMMSRNSQDERIRKFLNDVRSVEKTVSADARLLDSSEGSRKIMQILHPFVESMQKDLNYREFVTDVRNHYHFTVHSYRRSEVAAEPDVIVETFAGAKKDAKSSAQTTHLAYTLLASSLAYRFHFYDPVKGMNTPRLMVLDEFGGKFDNEKPRDIVRMFTDLGFQAVLVSPMSKADLLAEFIQELILVYKCSASESKVKTYRIQTIKDFEAIIERGAEGKRDDSVGKVAESSGTAVSTGIEDGVPVSYPSHSGD